MKYFKIIFPICVVLLLAMLILWFYKPLCLKYPTEIKKGNVFIENLVEYHGITDTLPGEEDYAILKKLNPAEPYKETHPIFNRLGENNFELIYMKDSVPYLQYNSITKMWEEKKERKLS